MARPRIFISSTFYDLKQVRADLKNFIKDMGYSTVDNNSGDIPYGTDKALDTYCYKEIEQIDILVSIIGGRFGSESSTDDDASVSQKELETALKQNKQVYIFIEKNVLAEYETYLLNKINDKIKYRYIDNVKIYKFIEKIKLLKANNNIAPFETTSDIISYLKGQFAGLFQSLLANRTREEEVRLIQNLGNTATTLDKMVSYLVEANKEKTTKIDEFLITEHPLINALKSKLGITFNFYINSRDDLLNLLSAQGFQHLGLIQLLDNGKHDFYMYFKNHSTGTELDIRNTLFHKNGKLIPIEKQKWNDFNIRYIEHYSDGQSV